MLPSFTTILGVPVAKQSRSEILFLLRSFLSEPIWHHCITVNNEMMVMAKKQPTFLQLLQSSTLNIADSTGVVLASRILGSAIKERSTGVDTLQEFCAILDESQRIFLLGSAPGIAQKAANVLQQQNPKLRIAGTYAGSPNKDEASLIIETINTSQATVLFVAYGAPQQDVWLNTYKDQLPTVRLAMGVGGTFDFLAGTMKRAPKIMQVLGLEWLWRFILQPSRYKRMWNAVVVFPWLVLVDLLHRKFKNWHLEN